MKQQILVLGASGFIGRQVTAALAASDWAAPRAAGRRIAPQDPAGGVQVDATDAEQLRRALDGVSGVVNCVAGDSETIVKGARVLFDVAATLPQVPRIVHLSSMAVYGDLVGEVTEDLAPGVGLSPYGAAKYEAETLAPAGLPVAMLRLGIVYGPGSAQWSERIAKLLRARRLGDLGSGGDGCCNLLYIADAVAAILTALRMPLPGARAFNLAGPDFPTWNEYFTRFAQALGAVPVSRVSGRRLRVESKLLAPPLKIAEILAGKAAPGLMRTLPPPIPPSLVRLFAQEIRMKVDAADQALGMVWTPLTEGIKQSVIRL